MPGEAVKSLALRAVLFFFEKVCAKEANWKDYA